MEDIRQDSVTVFDTCFTNNHIRMLKVLLPFSDASMQRHLAIYIKFLEIQYIMKFFRQSSPAQNTYYERFATPKSFDFGNVCDELLPYCNMREKHQFTQIRNMLQTMRNMQDMMEMMETMKELFPEGMGGGDDTPSGFNADMLTAMSSMFGNGNMDFSQMANLFSDSNMD